MVCGPILSCWTHRLIVSSFVVLTNDVNIFVYFVVNRHRIVLALLGDFVIVGLYYLREVKHKPIDVNEQCVLIFSAILIFSNLGPLSCFAPARSAESGVGLWEGLQLGSGVSSQVGSPAAKSFDAFVFLHVDDIACCWKPLRALSFHTFLSRK